MVDKLMYIPNDDTQNYPFCILQIVVDRFGHNFNVIFIVDIAIGAPYDGPDGKGAVYIYLGSIDGVMEKHSQVNIFSNFISI